MKFYPEGHLIDTFENRAAMQSPASLSEAMRDGTILEARAVMCDSKHNLIVDFKFMKGIIPREEGAIGIKDGTVRGYRHYFPGKPAGLFSGTGLHTG